MTGVQEGSFLSWLWTGSGYQKRQDVLLLIIDDGMSCRQRGLFIGHTTVSYKPESSDLVKEDQWNGRLRKRAKRSAEILSGASETKYRPPGCAGRVSGFLLPAPDRRPIAGSSGYSRVSGLLFHGSDEGVIKN